jgi:hypothetical protein
MANRYSPTGKRITGTFESLEGVALISKFSKDDTFEYEGSTDVWWDNQKTQKNAKGEYLFVDEDGGIWPSTKLRTTKKRKK